MGTQALAARLAQQAACGCVCRCRPLCKFRTQPQIKRRGVWAGRYAQSGDRLRCCASLELTEDNVVQVLQEARVELLQLFDESVGITGKVSLVELDGPTVVLRLQGRFWHQRDMVLARMAAFLKQNIPEIMDVEIEDENQLDDSPESF